MSWKDDKKWTDNLIPYLKCILGMNFIGEATLAEDQKHNTDLIVLDIKPLRFACRIRTFSYYKNFSDEFTIRKSRPFGTKTELQKIKEGFGDYLLYAFATEDKTKIHFWRIIDLKAFRKYLEEDHPYISAIPNGDESSYFAAFECSKIPENIVYATGGEKPPVLQNTYVKPGNESAVDILEALK